MPQTTSIPSHVIDRRVDSDRSVFMGQKSGTNYQQRIIIVQKFSLKSNAKTLYYLNINYIVALVSASFDHLSLSVSVVVVSFILNYCL